MPLDEQGPSPPGRRRSPRRTPRKPARGITRYPRGRRPDSGPQPGSGSSSATGTERRGGPPTEPGACGPGSRPSAICRVYAYPQSTACVRGRWDGRGARPHRSFPARRPQPHARYRTSCGPPPWWLASRKHPRRHSGISAPLRQVVCDGSGTRTSRPGVVPGPSASRRCEPTTHHFVSKVLLPPPHYPPDCRRQPTAAAWFDVG
jgi:hypothetical protein